MSKYVKELMMDQLRADLDGNRSRADPGPEGAGRHRRVPAPPRPAEEVDPAPGAQEHAGPPGLHRHGDGRAVEVPRGALGGSPGAARASPSWPRRSRTQVKTLKKPEIKGGAVDGVVIGPEPGRGHHQAAQPRGADRPGAEPPARPGPRGAGAGQLAGQHPDRPARGLHREAPGDGRARRGSGEPPPKASPPRMPASPAAG